MSVVNKTYIKTHPKTKISPWSYHKLRAEPSPAQHAGHLLWSLSLQPCLFCWGSIFTGPEPIVCHYLVCCFKTIWYRLGLKQSTALYAALGLGESDVLWCRPGLKFASNGLDLGLFLGPDCLDRPDPDLDPGTQSAHQNLACDSAQSDWVHLRI